MRWLLLAFLASTTFMSPAFSPDSVADDIVKAPDTIFVNGDIYTQSKPGARPGNCRR